MSRWWIFAVRCFLGGLLIAASLSKLADGLSFAVQLEQYRVLPLLLVRLTAVGVPMLELLLGLMLVGGWFAEPVRLLTTLLYGAFALMVAQAWMRGLNISCGCFSMEGEGQITGFKVVQNFLLLGLAFWLYRKEKRPQDGRSNA